MIEHKLLEAQDKTFGSNQSFQLEGQETTCGPLNT